jgi:hypothetical protein
LQALAVDIEQPAMKCAPQTAILETSIGKIGAAVRTSSAKQSTPPSLVSEDYKIFAKQPHWLYRAVAAEFVDQRSRLPIAAQ